MTEDFSLTSDYWRKLLKLDEEDKEDPLKKFNYPHRYFRPLFYSIFGVAARFYFKIRPHGTENLPAAPPYIIAPNHVSSLDYPTVAWAMGEGRRKDFYVLATKHFYDIPFTRFFMKVAANVERIDTVDDFFSALRAAARLLKRGKSLYINPEGTRSTTGKLLPFRPGVGILSVELNVPVVPVYIKGTHELLPPGSIFPRPGVADVYFGKPVYMDDYRPKLKQQNAYYVYKEVTDEVRLRIEELARLQ